MLNILSVYGSVYLLFDGFESGYLFPFLVAAI